MFYDVRLRGEAEHAELRAMRPGHRFAEAAFGPLLLGYEDCRALLRDPACAPLGPMAMGLHGLSGGDLEGWWDGLLFNAEGARHRRLRAAAARFLAAAAMDESIVAWSTRAALERLSTGESVRVADEIALPSRLLLLMSGLGMNLSDLNLVADWAATLRHVFDLSIDASTRNRLDKAVRDVEAYFGPLIAARRHRPGHDALSRLLRSGEWSDADVLSVVSSTLFGGTDAANYLLTNALRILLGDPQGWTAVGATALDAERFVDEVLRFEPSAGLAVRVTTRESTVGGIRLGAGRMVGASLLAAGRDPEVFRRAEEFCPGRPGPPGGLAFGAGSHACPGARFARRHTALLLRALAGFPALHLASGGDRWSDGIGAFRGLPDLAVAAKF